MDLWFPELINPKYFNIITPLILIYIGYKVEKHYTGRVAIFANTIALNIFFSTIPTHLNEWLVLYLNVGLIFGVIALISYEFLISLSSIFYALGAVYSSIVAGILLLYGLLVG
jgi:hypothetical protein